MLIGEVCTRDVVHCRRATSVAEVAKLMRNHHVGDVIVVDAVENGVVPVGIVTDRDLVVEVLAQGVDPDSVTAQDVMGGELVTAMAGEALDWAIWHMRSKGVRRLPVVDERRLLVGVLTADDVTRLLAQDLAEITRIVPSQVVIEQSVREQVR
jgi:CBS domain-containing protein